jgi:hypothetical protein
LLGLIENGFDGFGVGEISLDGEVGGLGELFFGCSGDHDGFVRVRGKDPCEVETDVWSSAEDEDDFRHDDIRVVYVWGSEYWQILAMEMNRTMIKGAEQMVWMPDTDEPLLIILMRFMLDLDEKNEGRNGYICAFRQISEDIQRRLAAPRGSYTRLVIQLTFTLAFARLR